MINLQNIQINKNKEFIIPLICDSKDIFLEEKIIILDEISQLKGLEKVSYNEEKNQIIINAKSLSFQYDSVFQILTKYKIVVDFIDKNYPVIGMTCATCSNSVETTLNFLDYVISASVNLMENSVQIKYFPTLISLEELKLSLEKIGFELVTPNFSNPKFENDKLKSYGFENEFENEFEIFEKLEIEKLKKLKKKTTISTIFALPIAIIGMFFHNYEYSNIIMLVLTLPVILFSGLDYYKNTLRSFANFHFNMDSLVGVSTGIAFIYSVLVIIFSSYIGKYGFLSHTYFESVVVIIAFVLIGKYIEEKAKSKTNTSIKKLLGLQENKVFRLNLKEVNNNSNLSNYTEIHISQVKIGDFILIKPGGKVPIDGEIVFGESYIDESSMTGEPIAKFKTIKDQILAGTINQNSPLVIKTQKIGQNTLLSQIITSVRKAQSSKAPVQRVVDKITSYFVPAVFSISLITLFAWVIYAFQFTDNQFLFNKYIINGISSFITVLVISCPCALGLATPTAIVVGLGKASNLGILIKDAESLELASKVDNIVFDKTGTLTKGKPSVNKLIWNEELINEPNTNFETLLKVIYRIESLSTHPLANAIVEYIKNFTISYENIERYSSEFKILNVENKSGMGTTANVIFKDIEIKYYLGNLELFNSINNKENSTNSNHNIAILDLYKTQSELANTLVLFFKEEEGKISILSIISIEDEIKSSAKKLLDNLKKINIKTHLLSGDTESSVKLLADKIGIKNYKGSQLPLDKSNYISKLQKDDSKVAMVGDGINDSTSLATADLSIAMGSGTDIALDVATVTILNSDLNKISDLIKISKDTNRTIKQNLFWAFFYNVISIPIASGLFIHQGLEINPMIASFLMSVSSISVVSNSIYLKYKK